MCEVTAAEVGHLEVDVTQIKTREIRPTEIQALGETVYIDIMHNKILNKPLQIFSYSLPDIEALI